MRISSNDLNSFLIKASVEKVFGISRVILPVKSKYHSNGITHFKQFSENEDIVLDSYRSVDPVKIFYYLTREKVYPIDDPNGKTLIVGVKGCDTKALSFLDLALTKQDFVDPAYQKWRENSIIISTDCQEIGESCHCNLMNGKPYAETGFDLNLSQIDSSYYIEIGSDKGETLLEEMKKHIPVSEATDKDVRTVEENRQNMLERLNSQNREMERTESYDNLLNAGYEIWEEECKDCIGCGGCTHICPTCYCLILNDESDSKNFIKVRSYDSCQYHGYARVAGGGTPRLRMVQRFRNRYFCKFSYTKTNLGEYGCTGCGRCLDVCPAGIDIRTVVKNVTEKTQQEVEEI